MNRPLLKRRTALAVLVALAVSAHLAVCVDDCCYGETWTVCPRGCSIGGGGSGPTRCCRLNEICAAGGGCIYRNQMQEQLEELDAQVSETSCDYYNSLQSNFQCGQSSYTNAYANGQCASVLTDQQQYEHPDYQNAQRKCLQQQMQSGLHQNYDNQRSLTCGQIDEIGYDSQVPCVVEPDEEEETTLCDIPLSDLPRFAKTQLGNCQNLPSAVVYFYTCAKGAITGRTQVYPDVPQKYENWAIKACSYAKAASMAKNGFSCIAGKSVVNCGFFLYKLYSKVTSFFSSDSAARVRLLQEQNAQDSYTEYQRFLRVDGMLERVQFVPFNDQSMSVDNVEIVIAQEIVDAFYDYDSQYIGFIGLARNSEFMRTLQNAGKIARRQFYFDRSGQLVLGQTPVTSDDASFCYLVTDNTAWACKGSVVQVRAGSALPDDGEGEGSVTLAQGITFAFDNQFDDELVFVLREGSDLFDTLFAIFAQKDATGVPACMPYLTQVHTYTVYCRALPMAWADAPPQLVVQLDNYEYVVPLNRLFERESDTSGNYYYRLKAHFQILTKDGGQNDAQEESITAGTQFFDFSYIVFDEQGGKIRMYGGSKNKLYDIEEHEQHEESGSKAWIAGVVIGCVAVVAILAYACWYMRKRKIRRQIDLYEEYDACKQQEVPCEQLNGYQPPNAYANQPGFVFQQDQQQGMGGYQYQPGAFNQNNQQAQQTQYYYQQQQQPSQPNPYYSNQNQPLNYGINSVN